MEEIRYEGSFSGKRQWVVPTFLFEQSVHKIFNIAHAVCFEYDWQNITNICILKVADISTIETAISASKPIYLHRMSTNI